MRTKIGVLKEEYASLKSAMDDLSAAYEGIAKERDRIAKRLEEIRFEIADLAEADVTPETLLSFQIEEVH